MRKLLLFALAVLLVACGTDRDLSRGIPPAPEVVQVPVPTFVPIDKRLTARCTWRKSAPLEVMPSVARERKKCLEQYEGQLDGIEKVQGKPVPNQ